MKKKCKKVRKIDKYPGPRKVHDYFSSFSSSSSSSSLLHCTTEARAQFGNGVGLKNTKKGGWKGKQGQNDVVLVPKNKKVRASQPSTLCNLMWQLKKRRRRRRMRQGLEAYLAIASCLVFLSDAFVKRRYLSSGEVPEGGVASPGAQTRLSQLWSYQVLYQMEVGFNMNT